ncbi:MAG: FixH family protein [Anaerolineales bacterium]|nr:FixH family protein [Anaerolineales bacterium]
MKKQTITIVVTTVITVVALLAAFIYFLPIIGPRYIMPMMMGGESYSAPADLDTSTERLTDNGLFRVSWSSDPASPPLNQIHTWTIHVETADGQAIDNAEITVDGGMPDMGHGLPTSPQVTQNLGNGDYLVEGMKFQMLGWWEAKFNINASEQSDNVTFNLILK